MIKKLFFPIIPILIIILIQCNGNKGPGPSNKPVLSSITLIDSVHYADSQMVSVTVSDPEGLGDIDSVWGNYMVPGNIQSNRYVRFYDDGTHGDASSADGSFAIRFRPSGGFIIADYIINIGAVDNEGNQAAWIDSGFTVIDTTTPGNPVLSNPALDFFHFYQDSQTVTVQVTDPDGPSDIDSVWGYYYYDDGLFDSAWFALNDQGQNGDTTAGDNRFTGMFLPDSGAFVLGNYIVDLQAIDSQGDFSNIYDTMFVAADSAMLTWPTLLGLDMETPHNYTDTLKIMIYVVDPQGPGNVDSVWGWYFYDNPIPIINNLRLYDDGTHGDNSPGDSWYTIALMADSGVFDIGLHFLSLLADDLDGHRSIQLDTTFVTVGNPTLSNVIAPDSLPRGSLDPAYIFIDAFDPDSLGDIDSVYFVVTRPDSTSNGIHIPMYDDGTQGDSVAYDGTYSTGIQAPSDSSQLGDYIFKFFSYDLDGNYSNSPEIIIRAYNP